MASPRPTPPTRRRFIAILSGASARERWSAARRISAIALFGGVKIDLRRAVIDSPVVDITAWSISGSVAVVVPARIPVELDGLVLMGTASNRAETEPIPGAPLIRVHARGLLGGVTVRTGRQRRHGGKVDGREPQRGGVDRHRGTLTMLVTDIVGSTQLAEQLGDQQWMDVLQTHNRLVRHEVTGRGGTEVKTLGDSFLVVFPSARQAILAAIAVQKAITAYRAEHSDHPVELRIGLHTGEVVEADDDVHGQNVVIAVRIANAAPAGEILVSGVTRDLTVSSGDLQFDDADDIALKGVSEPWRVYRVCWD